MDSAPQVPTQKKVSGRTKAALWLMIAPTALLFASFVLFAVVNWVVFGDTTGTSVFRTIANIVLFLTGVVGVITWLPGLIIGIVLLATKPQPTA